MTSAYEHGRNAAQRGKQRMMEQQEITMLRESYERELNRIRASAMFILKPEKRAGLNRIFNECCDLRLLRHRLVSLQEGLSGDRYNKYVGEVTAWCRDEGIKVSADTETAYLFEHITGPETERENFRRKPPWQFRTQHNGLSV
jgi:hypothetical protein